MSPKKILVIEDDPVGRQVIVDYLTAHGYEVSTATNGDEGVTKAATEKPDLVVCDILLPRKSGFEVCFEIKSARSVHSVPVVLMSAVCNDSYSEFYAAVNLRADGFLVKPFAMSSLLSRVQMLLPAA